MPEARIVLEGDRTAWRPHDRVRGEVFWSNSTKARLELLWTTRGRGDVDTETIAAIEWTSPVGEAQAQPFTLELPAAPWSFSGELVTLIWRLRLLLDAGVEATTDIIVSPTGAAVDLHAPSDT